MVNGLDFREDRKIELSEFQVSTNYRCKIKTYQLKTAITFNFLQINNFKFITSIDLVSIETDLFIYLLLYDDRNTK